MAVQREFTAEVSDVELEAEQLINARPTAETTSSSAVTSGWGSATSSFSEEGFPEEFKYAANEEFKVIKFIDPTNSGPFASYKMHWLTQLTVGKRSFVSPGPNDPLTVRLGSTPSQKYAFTIVNLSEPDGFKKQILTVGVRLFGMLKNAHANEKSGPLTNGYWAINRTGKLTNTGYNLRPIKERDLLEDWGIDPIKAAEFCSKVEPYDKSVIKVSSYEELTQLVNTLSAAQ